MGRIRIHENTVAGRCQRWQDDPLTGEFSEYGRQGHLAPVLALLCAAILFAALVAAFVAAVLR